MSRYLLDTGVALMATSEPERLSAEAKAAILAGPAYLSVVSYWEVMIKSMKGLLDVGDPRLWFDETIETLSLQPLLHRPEHVAALFPLRPLHFDPFDRALIAQAIAEDLTLVTTDSIIPGYAPALRVIR